MPDRKNAVALPIATTVGDMMGRGRTANLSPLGSIMLAMKRSTRLECDSRTGFVCMCCVRVCRLVLNLEYNLNIWLEMAEGGRGMCVRRRYEDAPLCQT